MIRTRNRIVNVNGSRSRQTNQSTGPHITTHRRRARRNRNSSSGAQNHGITLRRNIRQSHLNVTHNAVNNIRRVTFGILTPTNLSNRSIHSHIKRRTQRLILHNKHHNQGQRSTLMRGPSGHGMSSRSTRRSRNGHQRRQDRHHRHTSSQNSNKSRQVRHRIRRPHVTTRGATHLTRR